MDNNNTPSIDPSLMAPQGVAPTAPTVPVTDHLIDITPGVSSDPLTPVSPLTTPVTPVQSAPLPDNKVIDITPSSNPTAMPITPTPMPVVTPEPLTALPPLPAMSPEPTMSPVSPIVTPLQKQYHRFQQTHQSYRWIQNSSRC